MYWVTLKVATSRINDLSGNSFKVYTMHWINVIIIIIIRINPIKINIHLNCV